ncbi:hypothetical protein [Amycolatopsis speibonae]|uniref:Polyprenyl synthetase n=1 Tax=Amycolatopsis speibonae TaxID=1450224 RepID=A0ABV7P7N3_9PSEU
MTDSDAKTEQQDENEAMLLVAGVADMALSGVGSALTGLQSLLKRSDTADLAHEGHQQIKARGRLALARYAAVAPSHLELLARRIAAQREPHLD